MSDGDLCIAFRTKSSNTCSDFSHAFYLADILLGSGKHPASSLFPTLNQILGFITQISTGLERIFPASFIRENSEYSREFLNKATLCFKLFDEQQSLTFAFHRIPIFKCFPCLQMEISARRNVF